MTKRANELEIEGGRYRGGPCKRWLDGVKKACDEISQESGDAEVMCTDTEQWKDLVNGGNEGVSVYV